MFGGEVGSGGVNHYSPISLVQRSGGRRGRMLLHALPNQGGIILCQWRRQKRKGELVQNLMKCNEYKINS